MTILRVSVALVGTVLAACVSEEPPTLLVVDSLAGTAWRLKEIRDRFGPGGSVTFVPDSTEVYTLEFIQEWKVKAREYCNTCEGTYSKPLTFDTISIDITCTEVACVPPPIYGRYANALNSVVEGGHILDELWLLSENTLEWLVHSRVIDAK